MDFLCVVIMGTHLPHIEFAYYTYQNVHMIGISMNRGDSTPELVPHPKGLEGFKLSGVEHMIPISFIQVEIGPVD